VHFSSAESGAMSSTTYPYLELWLYGGPLSSQSSGTLLSLARKRVERLNRKRGWEGLHQGMGGRWTDVGSDSSGNESEGEL
jgi:hypothetical protein